MNIVRRWEGWKHELIPAWLVQLQAGGHLLAVLCDQNSWQQQQQAATARVCGYLHRLDRGGPRNCTPALVKIFPRYRLYWSSFMFFKKHQTRNAIKCLGYEAPPAAGRPDPRIINVETRTNCANNSANNSCLRNWLPIASSPSARYNVLGIGQASMQPCWTK